MKNILLRSITVSPEEEDFTDKYHYENTLNQPEVTGEGSDIINITAKIVNPAKTMRHKWHFDY